MLVATSLALLQISSQTPAPAPTPEETLALELVNRMRADPAAEATILLGERPREPFDGFDPEMFQTEMEALEAQPPLVMHTRLVAAARNHVAYTARHKEFGHQETEGQEGFTGEYSDSRAAFAGYPESHGRVLENAGSFITGGVQGNHWGCAVDDGPGGTGGMQKRRGHRMAIMWPLAREYGAGFHWHRDGRCEGVMLFGQGEGHRLVGGVAFLDLDGDGFYDVGEGLGGVRIRLAKAGETMSWPSGAYTLDAESDAAEAGGKWTAQLLDLTIEHKAPKGAQNLKLDAAFAEPLKEHLEGLVKAAAGPGKKARVAGQDLAVWLAEVPAARGIVALEEPQAELCQTWKATQTSVIAAVPTGILPEVARRDPARRGSLAADWMRQAQDLALIHEGCAHVEASRGAASTRRRKVSEIRKIFGLVEESTTMPSLLPLIDGARARVEALGEK